MIGVGLALLAALVLALFPFGEALAVAIQPHGDGQGEDLGGCPEGVDDEQTEDDPIVSPTDQGFGAAGDQRVVVHAGPIEREAAFATQGIIDGPQQGCTRSAECVTTDLAKIAEK